MNNPKQKSIYADMLLNIVSSTAPVLFLQFLIQPALSARMSDASYGLVVTVLAFFHIVPSAMGNVLNNIRLLHDQKYRQRKLIGDFPALLLIAEATAAAAVIIFLFFYVKEAQAVDYVLSVVLSFLWLCREYYTVTFRLRIDYIAALTDNACMVVGHAVGYGLYLVTGHWLVIWMMGYAASLCYLFSHSALWREPFRTTKLFSYTGVQSVWLLGSGLLARFTSYADKLLMFPLLGGSAVAVYYVASVFGKVISLAISPVSSVVLSYLAKFKKIKDSFWHFFLIAAAFCAVSYGVCLLLSKPVLSLLYPQYLDEAIHYIYLTTATAILGALIAIVNPFIMKLFGMHWQMIINGLAAMCYVLLCISMLQAGGIKGFCAGAMLTNALKLAAMLILLRKKQLQANP